MKIFLLSFTLLFSNVVFGEILETDSLNDIKIKYETLLKNYKPNQILVVFGINNTILYADDAVLQVSDENFKPLMRKVFSQLKQDNAPYLNEVILTNYKHSLVDSKLSGFIKDLIKQGSPTLAISSTLTGNLNQILRLETWLADYLKKYDIDFSESFSGSKDFVFRNLKVSKGTYPNYYKGILSTNKKYSKAQILTNFLLQIRFTPKAIIVIDQDLNTLNGFEQQFKGYNKNIVFQGFHYTALAKLKFPEVSDQQFINFWQVLVDKVNKTVRSTKSAKSKDDPYAE